MIARGWGCYPSSSSTTTTSPHSKNTFKVFSNALSLMLSLSLFSGMLRSFPSISRSGTGPAVCSHSLPRRWHTFMRLAFSSAHHFLPFSAHRCRALTALVRSQCAFSHRNALSRSRAARARSLLRVFWRDGCVGQGASGVCACLRRLPHSSSSSSSSSSPFAC